jgi:hypothetical protein
MHTFLHGSSRLDLRAQARSLLADHGGGRGSCTGARRMEKPTWRATMTPERTQRKRLLLMMTRREEGS